MTQQVLLETIPELIARVDVKLKRHTEKPMESLGVTAGQRRVMVFIATYEQQGVVQQDLVIASGRRSATISSMIKSLEVKGYIARQISVSDGRRKNLRILPKGKALIKQSHLTMGMVQNGLLANLTLTEQHTLRDLLVKIEETI